MDEDGNSVNNNLDNSIFTRTPDDESSSSTGSRSSPHRAINHEEQSRSTFARAITGISVPPRVAVEEEDPSTTVIQPVEKHRPVHTAEEYLSRAWALIVLSVAICGFLVAFVMLMYVSQRVCSNMLLANSQFMGILLLMAVMMLFLSVLPWLLPPSPSVCVSRHVIHPLLLVVCFAILLVKAMHLRSLLTIGLGGSIPQINQLLSLLFMVTVQLVILIEWYLSVSPIKVTDDGDGFPMCEVGRLRFFLLHIYPCVLMLLAFFYGVSVVNFKSNFNEGRLVAFTLILAIPAVTIWLLTQNFANEPLREATVAIGIVATALIILCVVFVPKMWAIHRESHLAKKRNSVYSQWPQWNSNTNSKQQQQQPWHPQRWFASYKPSAYRPFSDLASHHPFYTSSSAGGSNSNHGSFFRAPDPSRPLLVHPPSRHQSYFQSPTRGRRRAPIPSDFPASSPRKARSRHRSSPREGSSADGKARRRRTRATSSSNINNGDSTPTTNFFTVGSPQSFYYYGDHKDGGGRMSRAEENKLKPQYDLSGGGGREGRRSRSAVREEVVSPSPRRYATPTSAKRQVGAPAERRAYTSKSASNQNKMTNSSSSRIPCRCCSQGSQKIAQISAAVSTSNRNNSGSSTRAMATASSLPSLVNGDAGGYDADTIIIAPDNLSATYADDHNLWASKYETR